MTVVNPKSISGITSITTASGSDNLLTIHTNNGTERLRIDSTGATKIVTGIVTTLTATTGIVTTLTANTVTSLGAVSGTTGTFTGAVSGTTGTFTSDVDIADKIVHTGDTDTAIRFPAADTITAETGGSERARIDSSGRLLIGDSNATGVAPLQVQKTSGDMVLVRNHATNYESLILSVASGTADINASSGGSTSRPALRFITNDTERLRITSAGQVNIGAASPTASENGQLNVYITTSSGKAQIVHSAGTGGLRLSGTGAGSGSNLIFSNDYNSGTFSDHWTLTHNGGDDSFRFLSGGTGGTERARFDSAGNFKFNSGFGSVSTVYGCRAWIQLNQGGSQSITGSGGVSSITDEGTGATKIIFTTAMPDDNFAMVGGAQQSSDSSVNYGFSLCMQSYTTAHAILIYRPTATSDVKQDNSKIHVAFFR